MNQRHLSVVKSLPETMVGNLIKVHEDVRRIIFEHNGIDYSIQHFLVKKRCALGNHYHTGKSETFTILEGNGLLVMHAVDTNGVPCGGVFKTEVSEGQIVRVNPFMVHTFVLNPGTRMSNYSSAPFNEKSMDMTTHTLVDPRSLAIVIPE